MKKTLKIFSVYFISFFILITLLSCNSANISKTNNLLELPGKYKNFTLLPNGWRLTPEGRQIPIGELPLNMVITNNERYAITSNSGMGINSLSVVDLKNYKEVQRMVVNNTWLGIVFNSDDSKLFVSGGNNNLIYIYNFNAGKLSLADSIIIGPRFPEGKISITGIDYLKKKNYILAVSKVSDMLYVIDVTNKSILKKIKLAGKCYDVKINHAQDYAYVSVWSKAEIAEINLNNFTISKIIKTGDHPCDIVITKNDDRLFVADANNNSTSVIDLKRGEETERIISSLLPNMPYGSTPNAVALNSNDTKLFIANANNNYLAVFDISKKGSAKNLGFIPTGWYPTSVKFLSKTNRIVVANGNGLSSMANPEGPNPYEPYKIRYKEYIGTLFKGTLSVINEPNQNLLSKMSKRVYLNTPYIYKKKTWINTQNIISSVHNLKSSKKIKYVFYLIKENRTYDQVFGDIPRGNGDSSLCLFGEKISPNEHKLALNFTLYDNFYVDAEVSPDGHNWSTAAYATDYVRKLWPVSYGHRGQKYTFEGGTPAAAPASGYIWNDVLNHHETFRNYGEFVGWKKNKNGNYKARDKDMRPYTDKKYAGFNLSVSDLTRYKVWVKDFDRLLKTNSVPDFNLIRLPNDHNWGTRAGRLTPRAYVAQNDYAFGLIVDKISHSKIWKNSIIFAVEDDAQNGPDHVDAHRSLLFVIGPYVKRNFVDHAMYSTSSVLKTIELILGLPPMTQFDLSATPILFSITNKPDYTPYNVVLPLFNIHKKNSPNAYGAKECAKWDFVKADDIPEDELNRIIWKSVKGRNSVMPAPVRSAFVNVHAESEKDDKD